MDNSGDFFLDEEADQLRRNGGQQSSSSSAQVSCQTLKSPETQFLREIFHLRRQGFFDQLFQLQQLEETEILVVSAVTVVIFWEDGVSVLRDILRWTQRVSFNRGVQETRNINGIKKRRKAAPAEIQAEVVVPVEEATPIYEDDVPDKPVGLFNEFGAPDPQGLPIEEAFDKPEIVAPAVNPAVAGPKWIDIPILDVREAVIGRRGAVIETMIPKFLGRSAGHQNIPADSMRNKMPIDFFIIFLSDDILTRFCNTTNNYAAMMESKSWGELTVPEFKVFICVIVFMGIVKLPGSGLCTDRRDSLDSNFHRNSCLHGDSSRSSRTGTGY